VIKNICWHRLCRYKTAASDLTFHLASQFNSVASVHNMVVTSIWVLFHLCLLQ